MYGTQEDSFIVAVSVAKEMKAHIIAESLILPACLDIEKTKLGKDAEKEINKIPLSNSTISRRINFRLPTSEGGNLRIWRLSPRPAPTSDFRGWQSPSLEVATEASFDF
jgi:hypothetical protein